MRRRHPHASWMAPRRGTVGASVSRATLWRAPRVRLFLLPFFIRYLAIFRPILLYFSLYFILFHLEGEESLNEQ